MCFDQQKIHGYYRDFFQTTVIWVEDCVLLNVLLNFTNLKTQFLIFVFCRMLICNQFISLSGSSMELQENQFYRYTAFPHHTLNFAVFFTMLLQVRSLWLQTDSNCTLVALCLQWKSQFFILPRCFFLNLMNTLQVILHVQANLLPQNLSNAGPRLVVT